MIKLISFLGNPGKQYELTRHNLPWLLADKLTEGSSLQWREKFKGLYANFEYSGSSVYLHKPLTFMNKSGQSVTAIKSFYKLTCDELLIVHDDVEMKPGDTGVKFGGGLAGHNGLRSVAAAIGTRDFYRLRIGVGRPDKGSVASFVLKKMTANEIDALQPALNEAVTLIADLIQTP